MVHSLTMDCVQKAETLIADPSADTMRYASLQLRMGIEYLFYELIPLYQEELPDDITTTKWQPREIIDALLECDPYADKDGRVAIGSPVTDGQSITPTIVKDVKAPNKRILKQHYHRLGSYLHAPVSLVQPDIGKWLADLGKTIDCLKEYKDNQVLINIRPLVEIPCDCGRTIKRNRKGVDATGEMQCPSPDCRAVFDVSLDKNNTRYTLRQASYHCPYCRTQNFVPVHRLSDGVPINCVMCNCRVVVRSGFDFQPLDGEPDSESMA